MNEWVSVKEELPDSKGEPCIVVLAALHGKTVWPVLYKRSSLRGEGIGRFEYMYGCPCRVDEITHWMYLPKPPKERG